MPIEISQCIAWRMSHASSARPELLPDKGQPDVPQHSHPRPQPRGRASRMVFEKFLYVLLYHFGKFFNRKRSHIFGNVYGARFGLRTAKKESRCCAMKAMR